MAARKLFIAFALVVAPAHAQPISQSLVVSNCGTLPSGVVYAQGQVRSRTQDTTGKLCGGGIGGSALVVSNCGTLPSGTTYSQGQMRGLTQDTTGKAC